MWVGGNSFGKGLKKGYSIAYWVDREQTFPHSQSGGMNWLCDSVTNLWLCGAALGQPVTPTVHWGQVFMRVRRGMGSSLCPPRPALWLAEARDNWSLQENH